MLVLLLLACAPEPTPEERADAAYEGCVAMYHGWCDCQPEECGDYTAEQYCAGYMLIECDP